MVGPMTKLRRLSFLFSSARNKWTRSRPPSRLSQGIAYAQGRALFSSEKRPLNIDTAFQAQRLSHRAED